MWINLFLKCRHRSNGKPIEEPYQPQPQGWNFSFRDEHLIMLVINTYHPILTLEFESSESAFIFETIEDLNEVYKCIMGALHGRDSEYKDICKVRMEK